MMMPKQTIAYSYPLARLLLTILLPLTSLTLLDASSRILPTRAINYTRYLNKQDFDSMFPGTVLKPGETPQASGYYVVYQHENLIYYFGPETSEIAAELYLEDLDKVVGMVQSKRATLQSAITDIQKFPRDITPPQTNASNNSHPDHPNVPNNPSRQPSEPPTPWWEKVLKIFGF